MILKKNKGFKPQNYNFSLNERNMVRNLLFFVKKYSYEDT